MASAPTTDTLKLEPMQTVTFTIARLPRRAAAVKTLQRLMRLEPSVQRGLRRLSVRRQRDENNVHQRGGRQWTARVRATKLVTPAVGEKFTLRLTPQVLPDIRSVEAYLQTSRDAQVAG